MRILAIDPGYERVGVAVLEKLPKRKEIVVYSECFKTSAKKPLAERILEIGREVKSVISKYEPKALAIEKLYFETNQKTAMGVAEARGVIIYEASAAGLKIFEYTPLQVKIAVTGYGKSDKRQVMAMLPKLIVLTDKKQQDDELDAVALGITCLASEHDLHKE
ncbi:MAG: crossover junction endodeoxyribonuclease RuvC [Candidatus Paceibacterota bacterium]|jgi:crossover junction endodeoxyribonuclease RuvC